MEMKVTNIRKLSNSPEHSLRYTFDVEFQNGFKVMGFAVFKYGDSQLKVRPPLLNIKGQDGTLKHKQVIYAPAEVWAEIESQFFKYAGGNGNGNESDSNQNETTK